mgnify:CR=1 FL=1
MRVIPTSAIDVLRERIDPGLIGVLQRSAEIGFLGGMPIPDQIDHALGFAAVVEDVLGGMPTSMIDLGTGGGVPGLVLACCWPECRVVLMDGSERRTEFLIESLRQFAAGRGADVVLGRAEELGHRSDLREGFQVVTSRSFGAPPVTAECGAAFLEDRGLLVVSEPPGSAEEVRWPITGVARCELVPDGQAAVDERFGYQVLRKAGSLDDRFPRRVGIPAKRPLF